jgi:hypothetical protein
MGVRPNTLDMSLLLEGLPKNRPFDPVSAGEGFAAVTIETFGAISDNFQSLVTTSSDVNESLFVTWTTRRVTSGGRMPMRRNGSNMAIGPGFAQAEAVVSALHAPFPGTPVFSADSPVHRRMTPSPASLIQVNESREGTGSSKDLMTLRDLQPDRYLGLTIFLSRLIIESTRKTLEAQGGPS